MPANAGRILICLLLSGAALGCRKKTDPPTVTINGTTWKVELATTTAQQYRGLSFRESLADDAGMLFVYPEPQVLRFCMRDCLIPLDIAMIGPDLRVLKVYTMQVEPDRAGRKPYSSVEPAQFALEVAGGALRRAAVRPGDRVTFSSNISLPAWGPAATPPERSVSPPDGKIALPAKGALRR